MTKRIMWALWLCLLICAPGLGTAAGIDLSRIKVSDDDKTATSQLLGWLNARGFDASMVNGVLVYRTKGIPLNLTALQGAGELDRVVFLSFYSPKEEFKGKPEFVELARKLEPGDTVQVEYRRGGDSKKATLVAENLGSSHLMMDMPEVGSMVMPRMPEMNFEFFESPWGDLRFVSLNPDLGEYFGTKEGVLVVKAPGDSSLPLKGGDVILSIGGRKPASPEHAMRILRSYERGETVSIEIMRKQKRMAVAWKVPSREDRSFQRHEEREEQSGWRRLRLRRHPHLQRA